MVKQLVRKGKVAVAVSPGYGGGWSTSASYDVNPMDRRFNKLFARGKYDEVRELLKKLGLASARQFELQDKMGLRHMGLEEVKLTWLPIGTRFIIRVYDGYEWVQTDDEIKWYIAGEEE